MTIVEKFNQWFSEVDGKPVETEDPSNLDQCFDLAFSWCDFLGIPRDSIRHFRAYEIFTNPNPDTTQYWDIVVNTPTGIPPVGALIIFGKAVGVSGHVCVRAIQVADSAQFTSEDQNWAGYQKAKLVKHSYNGVLGWLVPKNQGDATIPPTPTPTDNMDYKAIFDKTGDKLPDRNLQDDTFFDTASLYNDPNTNTAYVTLTASSVNKYMSLYRQYRDQIQSLTPPLTPSNPPTVESSPSASPMTPDGSINDIPSPSEEPVQSTPNWLAKISSAIWHFFSV